MKNDVYLKSVLTVIAISLSILVIQNSGLISTVHAEANEGIKMPDANYGLVPLNKDGSVNVNVVSNEVIQQVDLVKVEGQFLNSKKVKMSNIKLPVYVTNPVYAAQKPGGN